VIKIALMKQGKTVTKAQSVPEADVTPLQSTVVPRYRQVEAILRDQIWLGELRPGDQLPTEDALRRRFAVSRATIRQALQILEQDNLIHREVARGTFVNPSLEQSPRKLISITSDKLLNMDLFDDITLKRSGAYTARGEVEAALGVPAGSEVFFYLRVFYLNGDPIGGEQVYVSSSVASMLSDEDMIQPAVAIRISQRAQRSIGRVDLRLSAITADARHSIRFETLSGAPLISILRTTYDEHERPLEHGHLLFRCDRCQVSLDSSSALKAV
jgi:GntR family transcriptional regulator